ncbi:PAS domain S-box protein [Gammaproteobacteria bacterium]|nr:PAS domain S-box protein [Gammaproteobacteria bacterium]
MLAILILSGSIFLQVVAALLALSLINLTGRRLAWLAIAGAVSLMAIRRATTLLTIIQTSGGSTPPLLVEIIAISISTLLVFGLWAIRPMFIQLQHIDELEAGLGKVIENSFNEIYIFCADTLQFLRVNLGARLNLGYTQKELESCTPVDLKPDYDDSQFHDLLLSFNEKKNRIHFQTRHQRKDGSIYPVDIDLQKTMFNGKSAFLAIVQDTTERNRAEKMLRESQQHFQSLIEHSQDLTTIFDWDGKVKYLSPSSTRILGYDLNERIGKSGLDLIHPDDVERAQQDLNNARAGNISSSLVYRVNHKDGSWRTMEGVANACELPDGSRHFVINLRDITDSENARAEKEKAESMLQHAQRMETIGNLAGGIAHDFNNLLTPILGYASLLAEELENQPDIHRDFLEMVSATKRAKELVQQLLVFSRLAEPKLEEAVFESVVREVMNLVQVAAPASIKLKTDFSAPGVTVLADSTQLHQVVMNLCTNAIDAMESSGGELSVSLKQSNTCPPSNDQSSPVREGAFVCLSISDTGKGIDPVSKERLFEPFYTTKAIGKGTGLGLAVVHGIVLEHGGVIMLDSELAKGTTVKVYLPALGLETENQANTESNPKTTGTEHVLVVDDDKVVGKVTKRLLEYYGYQVSLLDDPDAAIRKVREDDTIDLVITDQDMPLLTGLELGVALHALRPKLPIILMTGFSQKITAEQMEKTGIAVVLEKPFTGQALSKQLRLTLEQES